MEGDLPTLHVHTRQAQIKSAGADKNTWNLLKSFFLLFRSVKFVQTICIAVALMKKRRACDPTSGIIREFVFQKLHVSENDECGLSACPAPPDFICACLKYRY